MLDLEKILKILIENEVEFIIVGGYATIIHGAGYVTKDLDICVNFSEENTSRILKAITPYHPLHRMHPKKPPLQETPNSLSKYKNLYLHTDLGDLDMLGEITGLGRFQDLVHSTIEVEIYGKTCRVLSIDALIVSKKALGRPKDNQVVVQLEAIKEELDKS
ncbi:nucleotidyltransferase [bacterium]|nr:nucleotidyltransferase [bacterium]